MKRLLQTAVISALCALAAVPAQSGSIYLTGHDVDFHGGQNGYDNLILDWLRGNGTSSEIAASSYDILLLRSDEIGGGVTLPTGFGTITQADPSSFADGDAFAAALGGVDVLLLASHVNCGGCDLSTSDSNIINGFASQIADFFNAGGDIYANTGANLETYYNFLPAGAVASGLPISGSSGFTATDAGEAIGIVPSMINGFATHNRFFDFDPDFTVFEVRGSEVISIGIRDAVIGDDGIGGGDDGGTPVPEPGALGLLGLAALGLGLVRRRRA